MDKRSLTRTGLVVLVVAGMVISGFSGVAAAETRGGDSVTVAEGETVDGLSVIGGTVIVRGTVDGNLEGVAGSVVVARSGVVTGDMSMASGSVRINGRVDGNVDVGAGTVTVSEGGRVGGDLNSGSESVLIAGEIGGNAVMGAEQVTLAETGSVGGDLRYSPDGRFVNEGGTVAGSIVADSSISAGGFEFLAFSSWVFSGYFMLVNLVFGAILLLVLPGFTGRVGEMVEAEPLRSAGAGALTLFGVPIVLVLIALTIIGIPLTLIGVFLYMLLLWIALIYGRFAVAVWALDQVDVDNRWLALFVGIVGLGLIGQVPIVGWLVTLATLLLGLGAVTLSATRLRRGQGGSETPEEPADMDGTDTDAAATGP